MKRKLLLLALMVAVVACVFVLSVSAANEVCHEGVYYSLDDTNQTAALTNKNVNCEVVNLVIPETITIGEGENAKTYTVTTINGDAFAGQGSAWPGNKTIKTVSIPATVTSIGTHAFRNCTTLEKIVIKGSHVAFSNAEFYNCSSLKEIDMSEMTALTTIGDYFCSGASSLTTVKLPSTVTRIGGQSFRYCGSLVNIDIRSDFTHVGAYAFAGCASLTGDINLPNLTTFGNDAFQGCSNITSATIGGTFTSIPNACFYGCSKITRIDFSGVTAVVTSIGSNAFRGDSKLTAVVLPSNNQITTIGEYAYNGCSSLTNIEFPETLQRISNNAFNGCSGLTSLVIPDSVVEIGNYTFQSCPNISSVKLSNSLEILGCNNFQGSKITEIVIPATLTTIRNDVFYNSSLKKVVFASTTALTTVDARAFDGTGSLKVILFAGADKDAAKAFIARFNKTSGWDSDSFIPYSQYDATATYSNMVVYGTTNCDECSDILGAAQLVATDLISVIENKSVCSCGAETVVETFDAPIVYLGYSKKEGNSGSICIGYLVNNDSLEMYKEITGKDVAYGVVAYIPAETDDLTTLKPVLDDGTLADPNYTISTEITAYSSFEFLMRGFGSDDANAIALVMCAYAKIGDKVYYLGINQDTNQVSQTEYATLVTYNKF